VRGAPAVLGLALGALALGPALEPGFVLRYDMVFVPDPPLAPPGGGFPRAVPSDQVVALLARVLPADVVQKLLLLAVFALAASGAAALVPDRRVSPRLAAAACYAWSAYLGQRLLLGQWALLLGYAGLPWVVLAAVRGGPLRLAAAMVPAAVGGFQAMLVTLLTVLPVTALSFRRRGAAEAARRTAVAAGVWGVLSLPWAVPALGADAVTDPAGVDAFAARADGPLGTLGSLLTLGGVWNAEAAVPGQDGWWSAGTRAVLAVVAVAGYAAARRGVPYRAGLAAAAGAGVVIAMAGVAVPGVLKALIAAWTGFGPLRDGQAYVAPLALLQAVGLGCAVAALSGDAGTGRPVDRIGRAAVGAVGAVVPLLVLPGLALGAFGRLEAVAYPAEWRRVQTLVNGDPARGALLVLPWSAHRAFPWNGGRVVLDPATKMFDRRVVWNDALRVAGPDGVIEVEGEDRAARVIGALVSGRAPREVVADAAVRARLAEHGVEFVLLEGVGENTFPSGQGGVDVVFRGRELVLLRL